MSYQGKKNIPRITVSLVLGKSAVGQQPFVARNIQGNFFFFKGAGERGTQLFFFPFFFFLLLKKAIVVGDAAV